MAVKRSEQSSRGVAELLGVQVQSIHDSVYRGKKRKYPGYIKVQKEQDIEEGETDGDEEKV